MTHSGPVTMTLYISRTAPGDVNFNLGRRWYRKQLFNFVLQNCCKIILFEIILLFYLLARCDCELGQSCTNFLSWYFTSITSTYAFQKMAKWRSTGIYCVLMDPYSKQLHSWQMTGHCLNSFRAGISQLIYIISLFGCVYLKTNGWFEFV